MKVTALIGASGTGKSYRAAAVAFKNNIKYIIDDGLLICENKILAGQSAKREKTKIASVKRALFMDDSHRDEVAKVLEKYMPTEVLILATSEKMAGFIANRLKLPSPSRVIKIEDIATKEEIKSALESRKKEGKHIIPVPTFEVKKDFSGYFISSVKAFFKIRSGEDVPVFEKTVIRPTYSYLGEYKISKRVLFTICLYEVNKTRGICKVGKLNIENYPNGVKINIEIGIFYGYKINEVAREVFKNISFAIEHYTAINVNEVCVHVRWIKI